MNAHINHIINMSKLDYNFPSIKNTLSKTDKSKTRNIHFNKDGKYCILSSADRTVSLWNPFNNVQLKVYSGHGHEVFGN